MLLYVLVSITIFHLVCLLQLLVELEYMFSFNSVQQQIWILVSVDCLLLERRISLAH